MKTPTNKDSMKNSVFDRENSRIKKFYLLTELGIRWYHRAKRIENMRFGYANLYSV